LKADGSLFHLSPADLVDKPFIQIVSEKRYLCYSSHFGGYLWPHSAEELNPRDVIPHFEKYKHCHFEPRTDHLTVISVHGKSHSYDDPDILLPAGATDTV